MRKLILKPKIRGNRNYKEYRLNPQYLHLLRYINKEQYISLNFSKIDYLNFLLEDLEFITNHQSEVLGSLKNYFLETAERRIRKFDKRFIVNLLRLLDNANNEKGNDLEFNIAIRNLKFLWGKHWLPFVKSGYFFLYNPSRNINDYFILDATKQESDAIDYSQKIKFNVAIYNSVKSYFFYTSPNNSNYPEYFPLEFISLVYEFIEIIKLFASDHELIIKTIMESREDANSLINYLERDHLLYWLLIAMKAGIGFEDLQKNKIQSKDILFEILEHEAKMRNCHPEYEKVITNFQASENKIERIHIQPEQSKPKFKLNPEKFSKTNLIRLLDAIFEGGYIDKKGKNKTDFMINAGNLFGEDLEKYANYLRPATNADFDYEGFFKKLGACSKALFDSRIEEKNRKK